MVPLKCIWQGKVDTEKHHSLKAQFGLILNWAFTIQSGSKIYVIEGMRLFVDVPPEKTFTLLLFVLFIYFPYIWWRGWGASAAVSAEKTDLFPSLL